MEDPPQLQLRAGWPSAPFHSSRLAMTAQPSTRAVVRVEMLMTVRDAAPRATFQAARPVCAPALLNPRMHPRGVTDTAEHAAH